MTGAEVTPLGTDVPAAGGIDVDLPGSGIRLAGTRWPGRGTPVLLLHGLAQQRRFWNPVVEHLAGLPVVAIDQRGHGGSEKPDTGYGYAETVADVATALDALAVSRAVVVGHSWGASVALAFAAAHPERSLAVVAVDGGFTVPGDRETDRAGTRRRLEPPVISAPPDDVRRMMSDGRPAWWTEQTAEAVLPIFAVGPDGLARQRLTFDRHMQIVDALLDYDAEATLSAVRCPAWLVSCEPIDGAADGTWSVSWGRHKAATLDRAAQLLAHPRLMRWGGAEHDVPLQWPALVAGLVRAAAADAGGNPR